MSKLFARFVKDKSGATAIEYGLIAALIALAIMVGAGELGNALNNQFRRDCHQAERQRELISGRDTRRAERPPHGRPFACVRCCRAEFGPILGIDAIVNRD